MPTYLCALDDSANAANAFYAATAMVKDEDTLILLSAAQRSHISSYGYMGFDGGYISGFDVSDLIKRENKASLAISRSIVARYLRKARDDAGVQNCVGLTGLTDNVAEFICKVAADRGADFVVIGQRGMGRLKRLFLGSVSKHVLNHCPCHTILIRGEPGPEWEHDLSLDDVKDMEERERLERMKEEDKEKKAEARREFLDRSLNLNITILSEEQERARRIREDQIADNEAAAESAADLAAAKAAEEEERARRIAEAGEGPAPSALAAVVDSYILEVEMVEMGLLE